MSVSLWGREPDRGVLEAAGPEQALLVLGGPSPRVRPKAPKGGSWPANATAPHPLTSVGGKPLAQRGARTPARARSAGADPSWGVAFDI